MSILSHLALSGVNLSDLSGVNLSHLALSGVNSHLTLCGVNLSHLTPPTLSVTGWWGFLLEPRETTSRPSPGRVEKVVPFESQNVTNRTENWVLWMNKGGNLFQI